MKLDPKLLHEIRYADAHTKPAGNEEDLHQYVKSYLKFHIPKNNVCKHHISPFRFLSDIFYNKQNNAIAFANRGGGKTLSVAILCHLNAIHCPLYSIANIAAEKQQAKRCYDYVKSFSGEDNEWFSMDRIFSTQQETRYRNGSTIQILTGSLRGCKSAHPHFVTCDEVDVMDWDVVQEVLLMGQSTKKHARIQIFLSTRQFVSGNMYKLLEVKPLQPGWPFKTYNWCVAKGEPVLTNKGWRSIEKINQGDVVLSFNGEVFNWDTVTKSQLTKKGASVIQVVLANGQSLKVTSDHPILTSKGWVEAGRLDKNHHLCYTYGGGYYYNDDKEKLDTSMSYMRGANPGQTLQGVPTNGKRKTKSSKDDMPNLWGRQITSWPEMPRLPHEETCRMASFGRRMSKDEKAPICPGQESEGTTSFIGNSTKDVQGQGGFCSLEQGPCLDQGRKGKDKGWTNTSLERRARISTKSNLNRINCQGMAGQIRRQLEKRTRCTSFSFPTRFVSPRIGGGDRMSRGLLAHYRISQEARQTKKEKVRGSQHSSSRSMGTFNQGWVGPEDSASLVGIVAIREAGFADVYDLSIENNHNFIAGGLIVHNCIFETVERCTLSDCEQCKEIIRPKQKQGEWESWYDICHEEPERHPDGKCRASDGYILLKDVLEDFQIQDWSTFDTQKRCLKPGRKGLVFDTYDPEIHCKKEEIANWWRRLREDRKREPKQRHLELAVIIDEGWAAPMAVLFVVKDKGDNLFLFDSIYETRLDTRDLVSMMRGRFQEYDIPMDFECRCDERSPRLIDDLNKLGLTVTAVGLGQDEQVGMIRQWLNGNYREGYPGAWIDPEKCYPLTVELETLKYKLDKEGNPRSELPDKGPDHLVNCWGYSFADFGLAGGTLIIKVHRAEKPPTEPVKVPTRSDWVKRHSV